MTDFSQRILGGGAAASGETSWEGPSSSTRPLGSSPQTSTILIASLLDRIAFPALSAGDQANPLRETLRQGGAANLGEALARLSASDRSRLRSSMPAVALEEMVALAGESDPQLFAEGLFAWARRQEAEDRLELAGAVYAAFSTRDTSGAYFLGGTSEGLRIQAAQRVDAILGRGALGPRAEFLLRRFAREASNPVMIAGMATGSLVFSTTRTALLSRFLASPTRSVLGARLASSSLAFLAEVPAFWATTKGLQEAIAPGSQRWDLATNARELAGLGLTLGALKLSGLASGALSRRLASGPNPATWSAGERVGHGILHQGGTLAGIMLGHRLEESVGLRPHVDGATNMIDSLGMLLQFYVGGRLSQTALGPRFQAYTQELESRARWLEGLELRQRLSSGNDGFGPGNSLLGLGGPSFAMASAGGSSVEVSRPERGSELGPGIVAMSITGEASGSNPVNPPRERGIRIDIPAGLPERTGKTADDRFAPPMAPDEILQEMRDNPVHIEIASRLEQRMEEWDRTSERDLGSALGEALDLRLGEIAGHPRYASLRALADVPLISVNFSAVPRHADLPSELRESIDAAAELMQVTQYAIRSNQTEILEAARARIRPEHQITYQELLSVVRLLKGPRLEMPSGDIARGSEVIGPELGVLSHGAGAMSSWLRVMGRRIQPGGLPWYIRFFATEREYPAVSGIRNRGKNPRMSPPNTHNFEGDPPIEPVYFNLEDLPSSDTVAPILFRTMRVQMLNVPASALSAVFSEDYVRHLPENAVLISAVGGVADPNSSAPRYPSDYIRERLDAFGRDDVEVVSLSGYVPADKLWTGERVMVRLSTREVQRDANVPREAASLVARLLAGESGRNPYVVAETSHWEVSANVGKVLKNIFTMDAGWRAGRIAREVVEAQVDLPADHPRYRELFELGRSRYEEALKETRRMMVGMLVRNEGIKESRADFTPEVWRDIDDCATIYFENLVALFRRVRQRDWREASAESVNKLLSEQIFNAPRETRVATTRNPRYGIARALHEMMVSRGLPFQDYNMVGPQVTVEGLHSLDPIVKLYHARPNIEQRRLPDAIYDLYRHVFQKSPDRPPAIGGNLRWALEERPESSEARQLQSVLREVGLNPSRIRRSLEGRDQRTIDLLGRELRRLGIVHARVMQSRKAFQAESRAGMEGAESVRNELGRREAELQRQVEFIRQFKEAALRGNVQSVLRIPQPIGPYENAFSILRQGPGDPTPTHQVFVRLNLDEALRRLTHLGMLLRRFAPEDSVEVDIRIPESARTPANFGKLFELELTGREIVRTFQSQRPGGIRLSIDRRSIESEGELRREPPSDAFYRSLEPLARWTLGRDAEGPVSRDEVRALFRSPRHQINGVADQLLRDGNGWVMLLTPSEGPIQSGIRAMLTRPEKATLMGIYSEGRLVDTFAVYRHSADEARVLSHHLLTDFRRSLPESSGYQGLSSVDFFQGIPVERFIRDYSAYAQREGFPISEVRPIALRSTPVEEALVGRNPEVNPAALKVLLTFPSESAESLIRDSERLYELPPEEARQRFAELAAPVLAAFNAQYHETLVANPLYALYQKFGFHPGQRARPSSGE